ncbi:helix-hairpin-helix domain-containing protein [Heyndrickxia oleronia]|uniref:Helix-hairpin-helix domain-containing protein n=1 Tax=Heyndrickxia oleronia TaxID=38875 RepID=A0AAW6SN30_9BACI|nr:helix-hairpin-helix domain-containing protein [Heyndrickxia oleronia]MDH5160195.1 helix-hairpin-helix domain-containing protein [Heyndrickxia oleronia]
MERIFKQYKFLLIAVGLLVIVIFLFIGKSPREKLDIHTSNFSAYLEESGQKEDEDEDQKNSADIKIIVDLKGEIINPGIYEANDGERVQDLITKAGGFSKNADKLKVNLAQKVKDEMVIYVPKIGEEINVSLFDEAVSTTNNSEGKVNINSANKDQLQTIPGIGPSKADAIIEYREQKGEFKKIEDIKNVTGIGEKTYEKLKDSISI